MNLDLAIDPAWGVGLLLAQLRVAAFAIAAPQLGTAVPRPGKVAFVLAVGLALTRPVESALEVEQLIAFGMVNAAIGAMLGWLVGILFHLFAVAGSIIDVTAATSIGSVLDPTRGEQGAVFSRVFQIAGLTLFHVGGGLTLLVTTLGWSTRAVPLDGRLQLPPGLAELGIGLVGTLMVSGFELAAPVLAALFLIELVLGLASRFAPTANVFLLGMPVKVGVAIVISATSLAMFPQFVEALVGTTRDTVVDVLNGVGVPIV